VTDAKEALGSMGNDAALACLSQKPRLLFEYFRQSFAQVTNPPIDPLREKIVMSLETFIGPEANILGKVSAVQCRRLFLKSPILNLIEINCIKNLQRYVSTWSVKVVDITYPKIMGVQGYTETLERVCAEVSKAILDNYKVVVLSDRNVDHDRVAVSALAALGATHQYLVRCKLRSRAALILETGEAREVHHFSVLLGYGADASMFFLFVVTCT
jgi:glutamate synthase (NADPH/NADH)